MAGGFACHASNARHALVELYWQIGRDILDG
jgi:CO dehydrogenase/acetyl-CoA synthase alpha subunit